MVAINQPRIVKIFLRYGQLPLGTNPDAEPKLKDIELYDVDLPKDLSKILIDDDVFSLGSSYGDPSAGDPAMFEYIRVESSDGVTKEIEIFNLAILLFMDNREETRRLFRIVNAIKKADKSLHPIHE